MSRPQFLADHDSNEHIVTGVVRSEPLTRFLRVRDLGMSKSSDAEVLKHAQVEGLLVVSHDVNTMPAAAHDRFSGGESFPGLFMIRQTSPIGPVIDSLVMIWAASDLEERKDRVAFLPLE